MSFSVRTALVVVLVAFPAVASALTVSGKVTSYPDKAGFVPVGAPYRPVTIQTTYGSSSLVNGCYRCVANVSSTVSTTTDAAGNYSVSVSGGGGGCYETEHYGLWGQYCSASWSNGGLTVTSPGSETTVYSTTYSSAPASITANLGAAPHEVYGAAWARRIGTGSRPVFFIEGYDAGDDWKTDEIIGLLKGSPLGYSGKNFHDYLVSNDYTIWLVTQGHDSGNSIKGSYDTDGTAFQVMMLVKSIYDEHHVGKGMVVGGFSQGGLIVRAGLTRWCNGTWSGASGGVLDSGCSAVNLWYAVDSPLAGARFPVSMQRYLKDPNAGGKQGKQWKINLPSAREMLVQWVTDGCNVNCNDAGGCDSWDSSFTQGCSVDNSVRDAYVSWENAAGTWPMRWSGRVPAVAISVGRSPEVNGGAMEECSHPDQAIEFFENKVGCYANHHLYINQAGGSGECANGSRLSNLAEVDGLKGDTPWCPGKSYELDVKWYPTFIPTTSSLDWPSRSSTWKDYWHNSYNKGHVEALPSGGASTLISWISEYSVGHKTSPVCGHPYKTVGLSGACRSASSEVPNGLDDDGDDLVDETWATTDGYCSIGEDCSNSPTDCGCGPVCYNGSCEAGEDCSSCPYDCGSCPPSGGTCEGACGGYGGGCYCDDACESYGDCCSDKTYWCGSSGGGCVNAFTCDAY